MDNINFIDLIVLTKIKPDTLVEKFGAEINASFFDSSNILGGLRTKGLIDFSTNFPDQNKIIITDTGKQLLADAETKSTAEFDALDFEILKQLSVSKRDINDISSTLNIRPLDLAFRFYKLLKNDYIAYNFKNANIEIMLTEIGFIKFKTSQIQAQASNINLVNNTQNLNIPNAGQNNTLNKPTEQQIYAEFKNKVKKTKLINKNVIIIIIVIIAFILFLIMKMKIISLIGKI